VDGIRGIGVPREERFVEPAGNNRLVEAS